MIDKVYTKELSNNEREILLKDKLVSFADHPYSLCFKTQVESDEKYYTYADEEKESIDSVLIIQGQSLEIIEYDL